jgi:hypothetical protein
VNHIEDTSSVIKKACQSQRVRDTVRLAVYRQSVRLGDKRMGLSFTIAAVLASAVILMAESRRTHDHILLSQIRDSPNLEDQVRVFIYPRNRVAQL